MIELNKIVRVAQEAFPYVSGAFYGHVGLRSLGIRHAIFDEQDKLFDTVSGLVYILTHECDVDTHNQRAFNNYILICPIINLEALVAEVAAMKSRLYY
jgi:hypothetical protein